jgi:enamine deaminase RidA (YjgF/YER057c/UK114 family)
MDRRNIGTKSGGTAFSKGVVVSGGRFIFVGGQVATDNNGNVIGIGDLELQTRTVFENIRSVLADAGAGMEDVVKITAFLLGNENYTTYAKIRTEYFRDPRPASSTVLVAGLANPDFLLEVEAIAVTP